MRITSITLKKFRNHAHTEVKWAPNINVISGPNGSGKTNLIDAVHYLCMSRSFVTSSDTYVVKQGESEFDLDGHFEGEIRSSFSVQCHYSRGEGKKFWVNESPLDRLSDLIGMVPVVVLSPQDRALTTEGPAERRAFIDGFISQLSHRYLRDLIDYRKVVKQRNKLLQEERNPQRLELFLEPWNAQLIELGSRIVAKRTETLNRFQEFLNKQYEHIAGIGHQPNLEYQTFCEPSEDVAAIKEAYAQKLEAQAEKERERELTIVGPHRDEILFRLDEMELRKFGSQGQHRLFALSLKMAQLFYYSDLLDDLPIFLLDDVFGDLDTRKTDILFDALRLHSGQTFITSAHSGLIKNRLQMDGRQNRAFAMEPWAELKEITETNVENRS